MMMSCPRPCLFPTRHGPAGHAPVLHRSFRADPATVRKALLLLRERFDGSVGDEVIGRLELALAEILNNICQHGAPQEIGSPGARPRSPLVQLCIVGHGGGIACAVSDDGVPLPPDCLGPRCLPAGIGSTLPEGGFGWFLVHELTASLRYSREGERNFLAFIVPLPDALTPDAEPAADRPVQ